MKKIFKRSLRRMTAMICIVSLLCGVGCCEVKADFYADREYVNLAALDYTIVDEVDHLAYVSGYDPSLTATPYAIGVASQFFILGEQRGYNVIGIVDDLFSGYTFSMIYVETNYGMAIGDRAFQGANVNFDSPLITDPSANFIGGEVTDIGKYAFYNFTANNGNMYFDNVTGNIGAHAFEKVWIKTGKFCIQDGMINKIGDYAFKNFFATSVELTDYRELGDGVFQNTSLRSFTFSKKVEVLGSELFKGCDNLTKIILPGENHIRKVEADAFPDMEGLVIVVPSGYDDISAYHFENYENISFQLDSSYSENSNVYQQLKETGANVQIDSATTDSPESSTESPQPMETPVVTESAQPTQTPVATESAQPTEPSTMYTNPQATEATQESLEKGADIAYNNLKYQVIGKNKAVCLGATGQEKKKLIIPDKIKHQGNTYLVTEIGANAFSKNKKIITLKIGKNVSEIGKSAFEECTSLNKISFGKNISVIRKRAFYKDINIRKMEFSGSKLKKVEKKAFSKGKHKKTVLVPPRVEKQKYYRLLQNSIVD